MQALIHGIVSFSIPGSFVGKQGDLRGEHEIGEATHADFVLAVYLFVVYFVLFAQVSFSFFQKYKVVPTTFYMCLLLVYGYQIIIIRI